MKKIIVTLAVLLLAAPAMAAVTITCTPGPPDSNTVVVSFTSSEVNRVRAIALDVQVEDPNVVIADVNCVHEGYNIYPGSISIDAGGTVTDYGTCAGAQDGNAMTSEQGSLYASGDPLPEQGGDLFILTLSGCTLEPKAGIVAVTVSLNQLRGGLVMEDPDEIVDPDLVGCDADVGCWTVAVDICPCYADVAGDIGPDPDGNVNTSDLSAFMMLLGAAGPPYDLGTVPDGWDCMDIAGDMGPAPDGNLNTSDLSAMMMFLGSFGPPYDAGGCMPAPPSP